ncbi:MAG TPA: NADPH:quinone oxidoreductase family protein [Rhodospirillales bacterium]|nr:NADPH:quinone oxidoreductase family protein [Rhodospirillales bacterium]
MRAVVCKQWCGPEVLTVEDVAPPKLEAGGVRIRVHTAGLNFADNLIIAGRYQIKPPLPFSPGFEVAGEVLECAPGVTRCKPGDRVMAVLDYGGFAEEAVADQESAFVLSDSVSDEVAAAFPVAYGTSHLGLKYKCALEAGESVLVHGATGGVGLTAVEIAKRIGATVIATASGAEKLSVAAAAGADHTLDSRAEDLRDQVKALTGGRGVDVVYDPVGGKLFEESLRCTANGGRILIVGFASGDVPQIPANILLVKNIAAIGYYWGAHKTVKPAWMRASFEELLSWLAAGTLNPLVSQTFSLDEAPEAMQALKARRTTGKVVLKIGS